MTLYKVLNKGLETLLVFLLSVLVIDVLWQVAARYLLSNPSSFTDELAGFLLIWVGLLGSAYVAGRKEHLAIDILLQKTRESRRRNLELAIHLCIFIFALVAMCIGGIWLSYTRFILNVQSAALQLPLGYVYLVLPLSGSLIMYYSIYHIRHIRKTNN